LRWHLDWAVSSVAQIYNVLSQVFSANLTLKHEVHSHSSEEHSDVDPVQVAQTTQIIWQREDPPHRGTLEAAMLVMHSPHSSTPIRTQAAL
jgi:hypothetical protein